MGQRVLSVGGSAFVDGVGAALDDGVDLVDAPSVAEARSVLAADGVDCVVAAGELPDAEGMAVVDALRESAPDVPVVLVPERGSERLAVAALRTDGVEYVPSTAADRFEQVAERVTGVLERRRTDGDVQLRSFKRAVEQAGHSIYITDTDGTIRYVNPAFEETTGFQAEQAVGRTPRILKSGEHDAAFYEDLWETILDGEVWQSELVNRRADGSRYVVNQTIAPIVVDGRIERFVAVNADITDRIRREERLETLHDATREWLEVTTTDGVADRACEQLAVLFDADAVWVCRRDGDDGRLVPAARCGQDVEPGAPEVGDWPDVAAGETRRIDREDGQPASELLLSIGDGVARLVSSAPGAFDDTDVAIARVFTANLEAVLESVENYRALERKNERLDEFAGIVSHDLQNPLSVAMGFLDLLEDRVGADDDVRRIRESLEHMDEIITDVLWLAAEGDQVGMLEPVSLRRSAERSWSLVETGDAALELDVDSEFRVEADPDHVHRLLENLFSNAVEHGGPGVTVRVGVLASGDDEGFFVEDDGPGIPAERREAVFDVGHTTSEDGTGFGLPIVERIVEGHGWSVDVEESESGGARFVVRF